jgi:hypothetical protein
MSVDVSLRSKKRITVQQLAKIRVCKVDYFILPLFLMPKLRSVAQNEWKKHPFIFLLLLVQK